mmetsp:Transcript_45055/g.105234  ORF Transcript_45055/g.105234 Transcript_45055/m.105234 type:complete len:164 (+) Transcript_45055:394-885(+)
MLDNGGEALPSRSAITNQCACMRRARRQSLLSAILGPSKRSSLRRRSASLSGLRGVPPNGGLCIDVAEAVAEAEAEAEAEGDALSATAGGVDMRVVDGVAADEPISESCSCSHAICWVRKALVSCGRTWSAGARTNGGANSKGPGAACACWKEGGICDGGHIP